MTHICAAQHKVSLLQHWWRPHREVLVAALEAELHNAVKACSSKISIIKQDTKL